MQMCQDMQGEIWILLCHRVILAQAVDNRLACGLPLNCRYLCALCGCSVYYNKAVTINSKTSVCECARRFKSVLAQQKTAPCRSAFR